MKRLMEKTAVVTGAAMGIGLGVARVFTEEGARVVMLDRSEEVFEAARTLPGSTAFKVDISDHAAVDEAIEKAEAAAGRIDILVNNAGILRAVPFLDMSREIRDLHIDVNIKGTWNCSRAVLPSMVKRSRGKVVNLSSVTGTVVADPGETAYGLTKAAIWGFTKALAIEFAGVGINVNMICPGVIHTPMVETLAEEISPGHAEGVIDQIAASIPLKRLGRPDEVGHLAAFLASDDADYITGQAFFIEGGSTLPEGTGAP